MCPLCLQAKPRVKGRPRQRAPALQLRRLQVSSRRGPKPDAALHDNMRAHQSNGLHGCQVVTSRPFYCFTKQHLRPARLCSPLQAQPHLPSQQLSSLCPWQATPLQWTPTAAWLAQPKWCQVMM